MTLKLLRSFDYPVQCTNYNVVIYTMHRELIGILVYCTFDTLFKDVTIVLSSSHDDY